MNGRARPDSFVALTNVEWTLVTIVEGPQNTATETWAVASG
jgi:hypothetical protein